MSWPIDLLRPGIVLRRTLIEHPADGGYRLTVLSRPYPSRESGYPLGKKKVRVLQEIVGHDEWPFHPRVLEWYAQDVFGWGKARVVVEDGSA